MRVFTPFWRRVLALGDPPKPLPAPKKLTPGADSRQRRAGELEARTDQARLGRRPARDLDAGRSLRARSACATSSSAPSPAIPAIATARTARAPHACRRICGSARSARGRSGTPRALPRPKIPRSGRDVEKFLSELGWREFCRHLLHDHPDLATRNLQANVRRLSLEARRQGARAPGSAAAPAIPSSMPACASSGTPA